ncbi:MAG TPA: ABC transporter permease [Terriglobia bacterium]|nr:ABC transporter permease [Terriglobia bacterium]
MNLTPTREAEIVEEVAQHLEDRYRDLVSGGSKEDDARRLALNDLSDDYLLAKRLRAVEQETPQEPIVPGGGGGRNFLTSLWQDLRYGLRQLRRNPGFTAVAVLTLALGIGANTAIFSVIDAVLLRPLAFLHPDQLVVLANGEYFPLSGPNYLDWQRENQTFSSMALHTFGQSYNLTGGGQPSYVSGRATEGNFFSTLGVAPLLGRTWVKGEDKEGANREVVLSYGLWASQFATDRGLVGRKIQLNSQAYTVVGVMPRRFDYPPGVELWVPMDMSQKALGGRGDHQYQALGRLKPGVTLQQAQADLSLIAKRLEKLYPESNTKVGAWVGGLHDRLIGGTERELWFMLCSVALVLLIACVNVANLLLARSAARQKEMAVRGALGASRGRLVRQSLLESVLLALLGGSAGLLFGWAGIHLLPLLKDAVPPGTPPIGINNFVLAFTFLLALATGLLFGLTPAWIYSRPAVLDELKGGSGAAVSAGRSRRFIGNGLVAAEIAISLALLIAAGLLLKSFVRLRSIDFGVRRSGILTAELNLPDAKYGSPTKILAFTRALLERMRDLPGALSAAMTDHLPLNGGTNATITLYGNPTNTDSSSEWVEEHGITPGYFETMGIPLISGRKLTEEDTERALALDTALSKQPTPAETRNAVCPVDIDQAMARMFWPGKNPIGQRFMYGGSPPWMEVVGVVGDTRQWGLRTPPRPEGYLPFDGNTCCSTILVLHTALPPQSLVAEVRQQVRALDPDLPLFSIHTMEQLVAQQTAGARTQSLLVGLFAGLALLLAAVGIYGVMAYLVAQRTHEIGIRMALGAHRSDVLRLVVGRGLRLTLIGVAIGNACALGLTRFLASLLYEVKPTDRVTFIVVSLILTTVALLASYIPSRRATKVDPMVALRYE